MTLASGTRLGPYEVVAPLGAGGMGEVYRARDARLGRDVAIKVLPEVHASTEESRQRFQREARTISKLSHPHICALYDVGRERDIDYLVMELLEGGTLADRLAKGAMPFEQVLQFGAEIASALSAAHAMGIVHRDLKPSNIMVTDSGIKLLDFGLAKVLASAASMEHLASASTLPMSLTEEGAVLGTLPHMAPEQVQGKDADARTDIFALGTILFEMAARKRAFAGTNRALLMSAILTTEPPLVSSIQPASPPAFDQLVMTCLAKDPAERWSSAHDLGLRLRMIAGERGTRDSRTGAAARRRRAQWSPRSASCPDHSRAPCRHTKPHLVPYNSTGYEIRRQVSVMGIRARKVDLDAPFGAFSETPMPQNGHLREGRCRKNGTFSEGDAPF